MRADDYPALNTSQVWLGGWVHMLGVPVRNAASLFFALHGAVTSLMCQYHQVPFPVLASRPAVKTLRVNALVMGNSSNDVLESAAAAVNAGYNTLKIKVGMRPVEEDITLIRELRRQYPAVWLRVDANGAWEFNDAKEFFKGVASTHLEYVEEPLHRADGNSLAALRAYRLVPLALDESLEVDDIFSRAMNGELCDVAIFKPTRHGSFTWLAEAAEQATSLGVEVVLASLMESEIGMAYLANLASVYGSGRHAHGLGTSSFFSTHALNPPLGLNHGTLEIPDLRTLQIRVAEDIRHDLGIYSIP
jgi:L-Ala-D/L-Glu epimerase